MVFLHPGEFFVSLHPSAVTTILGSCVSVCLWDEKVEIGGMNHFLLPWSAGSALSSARYGDFAMDQLLRGVLDLGADRKRVRALVFGGACVLEPYRDDQTHLGARNAAVALRFLSGQGIPVTGQRVGGRYGYKVRFLTHQGTASLRSLRSQSDGK